MQQELIATAVRRRLERRSECLDDITGLCHEMLRVVATMVSPQAVKKATFMMFMRTGLGQRGALGARGRDRYIASALDIDPATLNMWHVQFLRQYPNYTGMPLANGNFPRDLVPGNPATLLEAAVSDLTITVPQGVANQIQRNMKADYAAVSSALKAVNKSVDPEGKKRRRDAFVVDYDVKNITAMNLLQQHAKRQKGRAMNGKVETRNRRNRNLV